MSKVFYGFLVTFILLVSLPLGAKGGVDFVVVVDQSRSIKKNLPAIKDFIAKRIFDRIAQPQDTVYLLSFDGQFYEKKRLSGNADIFDVGYALDSIQAVGEYTDITNAVVQMSNFITTQTDPQRRKIIFFMTDGLNEPPAYSLYPVGLDSDLFSEAVRHKKEGGWDLFITGIGEKTSAPELAEILDSKYMIISENPTLVEFDKEITEQLNMVREGKSHSKMAALVLFSVVLCGGGAFFAVKKVLL
ncbi:MAG: VWA domain-containing protein [Spirochaetes bacterium]|jgi:Mg-chelatase subunit ChlD|nr:VWA domain-containing protein [Spirochaetota bacterium]